GVRNLVVPGVHACAVPICQSVSATSTSTSAVIDNSSLTVSIDNTAPKEGDLLTATPVIGDGDDASATVHYQWQVADGLGGWTNRSAERRAGTEAGADWADA